MPIIRVPPEAPVPPPEQQSPSVQITAPAYKHSLVDGKQVNYASLLTYVAGSNWPVDYYSQIVGKEEELSPYQPEQQAVYQQYHLVKDYVFKLQAPLNISFDSDTQVVTCTGSAIIYPYLKPNKGDPLLGDIGDGRIALFTITSAEPKTMLKETCYEVSFELSRFMDEPRLEALNKRVVKTSYFQRDYMVYNQNPIIASEDLQDRRTLEKKEKDLLNYWLTRFTSRAHRTILVPGQDGPTYDPFITKAIFSMYESDSNPHLRRIRQLNVDAVPLSREVSLWDAILEADKDLLFSVFKTMQSVSVMCFVSQPLFASIRYSGIDFVVLPKATGNNVDYDYEAFNAEGTELVNPEDMELDLASLSFTNVLNGLLANGDEDIGEEYVFVNDEIPVIHPMYSENGYVVTSAFYEESVGRSKLEVLLTNYFDHQILDLPALYAFCENAKSWGRLEQFYYIPILLAMLKVSQRMI